MEPFLLDTECVGTGFNFTQFSRAFLTIIQVLGTPNSKQSIVQIFDRLIRISRGAKVATNLVAAATHLYITGFYQAMDSPLSET